MNYELALSPYYATNKMSECYTSPMYIYSTGLWLEYCPQAGVEHRTATLSFLP